MDGMLKEAPWQDKFPLKKRHPGMAGMRDCQYCGPFVCLVAVISLFPYIPMIA
jgi:hypothetical protein